MLSHTSANTHCKQRPLWWCRLRSDSTKWSVMYRSVGWSDVASERDTAGWLIKHLLHPDLSSSTEARKIWILICGLSCGWGGRRSWFFRWDMCGKSVREIQWKFFAFLNNERDKKKKKKKQEPSLRSPSCSKRECDAWDCDDNHCVTWCDGRSHCAQNGTMGTQEEPGNWWYLGPLFWPWTAT